MSSKVVDKRDTTPKDPAVMKILVEETLHRERVPLKDMYKAFGVTRATVHNYIKKEKKANSVNKNLPENGGKEGL